MLLGARHSSGAFFCASTRTRHWSAAPPAMSDKLKLTALDADDLGVISTAVQDALVAVRDCVHFKDERRFVLLLNRFRWEADPTVDSPYWRTHSALVFNEVTAVRHHNIPLHDPDRMLELLTLTLEYGGGNDRLVTLRFAPGRALPHENTPLSSHFGGVGGPWPPPPKPAPPSG